MPLYLVVHDDPNPERVFRLQDAEGLVIGRSPVADLQLADLSVSRRHCLLRVQGERVWLTDTQSLNGTWFERERLGETPLEVPLGRPFRLGTTWLSLHTTPGISEDDWNSQNDPGDYLRYLPLPGSQRKLRLFACACYRQVEGEVRAPHHETPVSTVERFADGQASPEELLAARNRSSGGRSYWFRDTQKLPELVHWVAETSARDAATRTLHAVSRLMPTERLCDLARDMLGDFFGPVPIAPEWRQWNHGTVLRMARQIYEERDFAGLPILADALEEAGCNETRLLEHCRSSTCHARGCWALDAILGKI